MDASHVAAILAAVAAKTDERHLLDRQAQAKEALWAAAFLAAIRTARDGLSSERLAEISRGERAAPDWRDLESELRESFQDAALETAADAAVASGPAISPWLAVKPVLDAAPRRSEVSLGDLLRLGSIVTFRFNLTSPRLGAYAATRADALSRKIRQEAAEGFSLTATARSIREELGLTVEQRGYASSLAAHLQEMQASGDWSRLGDADWEKLRRAGVTWNSRAKIEREGLSTERIADLVGRYRERLLQDRAEAIAESEAMRAANFGAQELWRQLAERGLIEPETRRQWLCDAGACGVCAPLDGVTVAIDEPFPGGLEPGAVHPHCRCEHLLLFDR